MGVIARGGGGGVSGQPVAVGARLYRAAALNLANNGQTPVAFDAESFDPQGMHDPATNPSRITIPAGGAGQYLVTARAVYAANSVGVRDCSIAVNGAIVDTHEVANSGLVATYVQNTGLYVLAVGDFVELWPFQNSGGSLAFIVGASNIMLAIAQQGT